MATGRLRTLALWLALATLAPIGCAGSNPFASRQAMNGGLKASVSQLEFENEKLRKEVGELKAETIRLDNQLAQESAANGEMSARLDDAKDLLRRQGANVQAMGGSTKNVEDEFVPPPASAPRSRRVKRDPPAASIRPPETGQAGDDLGFARPGRTAARDLGPDDPVDDRWLPVARGLASQVRQ